MDKTEFKDFCQKEFCKRGFRKIKNAYYLTGTKGVMTCIVLQKSYYGPEYYVNFYFFIGDFENIPIKLYPKRDEYDVYERVIVMAKAQKDKEKFSETCAIEYEEYTEETLRPYFDKEFDKRILPPIYAGKKYILDNLNKLYQLDRRKDEVLKKLQE